MFEALKIFKSPKVNTYLGLFLKSDKVLLTKNKQKSQTSQPFFFQLMWTNNQLFWPNFGFILSRYNELVMIRPNGFQTGSMK